jgi:hypothetical protein
VGGDGAREGAAPLRGWTVARKVIPVQPGPPCGIPYPGNPKRQCLLQENHRGRHWTVRSQKQYEADKKRRKHDKDYEWLSMPLAHRDNHRPAGHRKI